MGLLHVRRQCARCTVRQHRPPRAVQVFNSIAMVFCTSDPSEEREREREHQNVVGKVIARSVGPERVQLTPARA